MIRRPSTTLERALRYRFRRPALLDEALTHSTYANENPGAGSSNERLEFLGDAVVSLVVSRLLHERVKQGDEGELSRRRARIVRQESLAVLARELELDAALKVGEGQRRLKVVTESTLADAYEALVGAVFIDGGLDAVEACLGPRLERAVEQASGTSDHKTALQEACHARGLPPPVYEVIAESGPDHARRFTCGVRVGDELLGRGEGSSKKAAEQVCARAALDALPGVAPEETG